MPHAPGPTPQAPVSAMLLCAGLGTRLRPLTDERPKALVPLLDRPLGTYGLEALARAGVTRVVANAHHLADQVEPGLAPWAARLGVALTVLREPRLLGTGGGLRNALPHLGDAPFVVYNSDVLAAPDLARALARHRETGAAMTMVLREDPRAGALGAIEVTADGRVARILDEGPLASAPTARCLFTGIYVLSPDVADDLPVEGCVVRHTLRRLLARGRRVTGVLDDGPWHDLGTPRAYADVHFALLRGAIPFPGWTAPEGARWSGEGATLGPDVALGREACVGRGARIGGAGTVERAVVWDGAVADAPLRDCVVTRQTRVPLTI